MKKTKEAEANSYLTQRIASRLGDERVEVSRIRWGVTKGWVDVELLVRASPGTVCELGPVQVDVELPASETAGMSCFDRRVLDAVVESFPDAEVLDKIATR